MSLIPKRLPESKGARPPSESEKQLLQEATQIIKDKDKEIEDIGNESMIFEMDLRNAKIEIERLKVLVVIAHSEGYEDAVHHIEYKKSWQQFQKENNL